MSKRVNSIHASYLARISVIRALHAAASKNPHGCSVGLRTAAAELEQASISLAPASVSRSHGSLADLLGVLAYLADWRDGTLEAEIDADRHLRAAKARIEMWQDEYGADLAATQFVVAARMVEELKDIVDFQQVVNSLLRLPLPVAVREARSITQGVAAEPTIQPQRPPDLEVAFLRFEIDGQQAEAIHFVQPSVVHDLEVEVRISRWAEGAERLVLTPISVEARDTYDLPIFRITRPTEDATHVYRELGRAILRFPQSLGARPYEFKYSAMFDPPSCEQPISVVGQRTLRLEGIDVARSPLTGYAGVDSKLVWVRDQLRSRVGVSQDEIRAAMILLPTIGSAAARGLQDQLFDGISDEAGFQRWLKDELRRNPSIAARLEEHPHAGGGIADLSFERIRIELKFEKSTQLKLSDCEQYVAQSQSYAAASDARISILCVLDNSDKRTAPFAPEDGFGIFQVSQGSPSLVIVILMQGNTMRPSDLSKRTGTANDGSWVQ